MKAFMLVVAWCQSPVYAQEIAFANIRYFCQNNERFVSVSAVDYLTLGYALTYNYNHGLGTAKSVTISERTMRKGEIVCELQCACGGRAWSRVTIDFSKFEPVFDVRQINGTCQGLADGQIQFSSIKGVNRIIWENGGTGFSRKGLAPGDYQAKIYDNTGCFQEQSFIITEPRSFRLPDYKIEVKDVSCYGFNNGTATIQFDSTQLLPYVFTWTSGTKGLHDSTLAAGLYHLTVKKSDGECVSIPVRIVQPTVVTVDYSVLTNYNGYAVSCIDRNDGKLAYYLSGGTPPYVTIFNNNEKRNTVAGERIMIGQLHAAQYVVSASDNHGCPVSANIVLAAPTPIKIIHQRARKDVDIVCNGTQAQIEPLITGGVGSNTYRWTTYNSSSKAYDTVSAQKNPELPAGDYNLLIADANGCSTKSIFIVNQMDALDYEQKFYLNLGFIKIARITLIGGNGHNYYFNGRKRRHKTFFWFFKRRKEKEAILSDGECNKKITVVIDQIKYPKPDMGVQPDCGCK